MTDFFARFKPPQRKYKPREGIIYILHFDRPYRHARHYIGWTSKDEVEDRIQQHLAGYGSPLVKAAVDAGIGISVAATMPGTRDMERHLKNRHDNRSVCPICRKDWLAMKKTTMTVAEVRQIVRSILAEAVCPVCGGKGAYIGLNDIECPNKNCAKFSQKQLDAEPAHGAVTPMKSIELDWYWDGMDEFEPFCKKHGVSGTVVTMNGPGGGNPLVKIVGPEDNVIAAVEEYDGGNGEADYLLSDMKDEL